MTDSDIVRKMADCVEAIGEVDGVEIEDYSTEQVPTGGMDSIKSLMMGQEPDTEKRIILTIDPTEGEKAKHDREPDNSDDIPEEAKEVPLK